MTTALFVGRFQPFHLGHLEAIRNILKENDKVVIVIGSSQEISTPENPFPFWERERMIADSLKAEGIENFKIVAVPDFMDDEKWASAIMEKCSFDMVYSANPWTLRCFRKKGIACELHKLSHREKYNSTEIRRRIAAGEEWESLVPAKVAEFIKAGMAAIATIEESKT
jgi:nicotinamide-nucleotide adenylyltransferase